MIAAYDLIIYNTPRVNGSPGIARMTIDDLTIAMSVSRPTVSKALAELIKGGYIRRLEKKRLEVVNWHGNEPVGVAENSKNLAISPDTNRKNLSINGKILSISKNKNSKNLSKSGKNLSISADTKNKNKEKREEAKIKKCRIASEWFFSLQDETKVVIDETLERIGKTYQKGKLNDFQQAKILLRLREFGLEVAEEACRRWNKREYEKEEKRDNYLYGIARGIEREWGAKYA